MSRQFYYAARSADGRLVKGSIRAESRDAAVAHLRSRTLFVTAVDPASTARGLLAAVAAALPRGSDARATFFRSFATLVGAGISVRRAIETLVAQSRDSAFAEALRSIAADVEGGTTLSSAMARHPREFRRVGIALIRAGEIGGSLDDALRAVADLEESDRALRKRVSAALAYPCMVTVAAVGLVLFLVAETMPAFASMFQEMHVALPASTRALIAIGQMLAKPGTWIALGTACAVLLVAAQAYRRSDEAWAVAVDRVRLSVPVFGPIVAKAAVTRFSRTFGSLLRAGVDVVAALEASADVVDSQLYRQGLRGFITALRRGDTLVASLDASRLFDRTFLQLVRAGEESGALDTMLLRLARHYELDVETALAAITGIVEPLLVCILGAAVGTIVASIIIPLYQMIGSIK